MEITINATVQDGKITFDIKELQKSIPEYQFANSLYYIPKPMSFYTKDELDEYVKSNPEATCKGIPTKELVEFIRRREGRKGQYLFLKDADLSYANLSDTCLRGVYLCGANLFNSYLCGADLSDADLSDAYLCGADLSDAELMHSIYNNRTVFPDDFKITRTMRNLSKLHKK